MKKIFAALILISLSISGYAHEGHNQAPGSLKSLHGGTVQAGKQINLEVIVSGTTLTIFPEAHEGKDLPAKDVVIEAKAAPKKGKPYAVKFTPAKEGLTATVDLAGANRLPVTISTTVQGKTDKFLVQVEE